MFEADVLEKLDDIIYFLRVGVYGIGFLCGLTTWRLFSLGKNQRGF
jgi:hypothetical protein